LKIYLANVTDTFEADFKLMNIVTREILCSNEHPKHNR